MKGIDVSEYNGAVNWQTAKDAGLQFAMLRCGYGSNQTNQDDPTFAHNAAECERLSIPYGVYLYSYALDTADAESELAHILRLLRGHKPLFPICVDMEDADGYKAAHGMPSRQMLTDILQVECGGLKNAGYLAGYYVNKDWYENQIVPESLESYVLWYARPGVRQSDLACGIWQNEFPETGGQWDGANISGSGCDTDISYADYPKMVRQNGLNGWKNQPANTQKALDAKTGSLVWTKCVIDTTMDLTRPAGVCYTVGLTCPQRPVITSGTPGKVCVCPVMTNGTGRWLCNLVGYGAGDTGIYTHIPGEAVCKRFVFHVS